MFRLTREVRFAVHPGVSASTGVNGHAGIPPLTGLGYFFALRATVTGPLDADSRYLLNIREIDAAVRQRAIPRLAQRIEIGQFSATAALLDLFEQLRHAFPPRVRLEQLALLLSPYLTLAVSDKELPMVRLSQKFEFSASHRLHNPALSDEDNRRIYGKCNNPAGHGHNYELQVTLLGEAGDHDLLMDLPGLEAIVDETILQRLDHKNLNLEVEAFHHAIPSVENIAQAIFHLLAPKLRRPQSRLASVTVWETPKTWCEYAE